MTQAGLLFVIAAPSGAGKTSLCKALLERVQAEGEKPLTWSCSYTTRQKRAGETEGKDYFFVDDPTFDRMIGAGEFAEWAHVHGRRYGTSRKYLEAAAGQGQDLLVEIDIQGAKTLQEKNIPSAYFIFIIPPGWPTLEKRLKGRATEPEDEIDRRLRRAREELLEWRRFDYIIVNDDFNAAVERLKAVITAARLERERMALEMGRYFPDADKGEEDGADHR